MALALCLAYLSNFISPEKVWAFSFFGLAYPVLLLVNFFFIAIWLFVRKKFAFFSIFAIILGFGYIGRFVQLNHSDNNLPDGKYFRVMTYNVRLFNYFEWEHEPWVRDSILGFIGSESPSVVCFQDFFTKNKQGLSEKSIRTRLSKLPYCHISYTYAFKSGSDYGIATFSKYPIINKGRILFSNSFNSCIFSDIVIDSDTMRVYNVHLQSIRLRKDNYGVIDSIFSRNTKSFDDVRDISLRLRDAYVRRANQVDQLVGHMNASPYPVVLCGDFNDTPVSYTYHQLLGSKKDAYRKSGGGPGNTYRGKLPSYRIDYIFYDKRFFSRNYKTSRVNLSDHFPVSCCLQLQKTAGLKRKP
ncbi:MAG: endonuclease/exonuclease/phosphatase family protein [Bacteroidales bacterium]|nr:endonuclease/exonuclease/phosphatase family protein [Bacteroidales bacterium]